MINMVRSAEHREIVDALHDLETRVMCLEQCDTRHSERIVRLEVKMNLVAWIAALTATVGIGTFISVLFHL